MTVVLSIKLQFKDRSILVLPRKFKSIVKDSLLQTVFFWWKTLLPRHWFPSARAAYHHRPRSAWYLRFKRRTGVGQGRFIDLLYTGKTRRWMTHAPRFTGTSKQATVRMDAPQYISYTRSTHAKVLIPDMKRELTEVSGSDRAAIVAKLQLELNTRVKRLERL